MSDTQDGAGRLNEIYADRNFQLKAAERALTPTLCTKFTLLNSQIEDHSVLTLGGAGVIKHGFTENVKGDLGLEELKEETDYMASVAIAALISKSTTIALCRGLIEAFGLSKDNLFPED
jgi:hypothetical protein